jgi:hypothetical protein
MTKDYVALVIFTGTKDTKQLAVQYFKTQKLVTFTVNSINQAEPDTQVFEYFNLVYDKIKESVKELFLIAYNKIINKYSEEPRIYFIGHSLGGVMATIFSIKLKELFKNPGSFYSVLITFGSPRVGDYEFAQWVNKEVNKVFRVVNYDDLVPGLIPCVRNKEGHCISYQINKKNEKINFPWNIKGLFIVDKKAVFDCSYVDENPEENVCTFLSDQVRPPVKPKKHTIYFGVEIGNICTEKGKKYEPRNNSQQNMNSGITGLLLNPLLNWAIPGFGRKRRLR